MMSAGKILGCGLALVCVLLLFVLLQERDIAPEAGWEAALSDPSDAVKVHALDFFRQVDEDEVTRRVKRIDHRFAALFKDATRSDAVVWRALETYDRLGFVNKRLLGDALRLLLDNGACQVKAAALRALGRHSDGNEARELILEIIQTPSRFPCIDSPPEEGEEPVGKAGVLAAALAAARDLEMRWSAGIARAETLQTLAWHFANVDPRVRAEAIETYIATGSQAAAYLGRLDERLRDPKTGIYERATIFDVFARLPEHARQYEASIDLLDLRNDETLTASALRAREAITPLSDQELLALLDPGNSAHPAAVVTRVATRGKLGRAAVTKLTPIIANDNADPALRAAAVRAVGQVGLVASLLPGLQQILAKANDASDPKGLLREALLRALASATDLARDLPTEKQTLETIILELVDDSELGLPLVRQAMIEVFWRAQIHMSQRVKPLLERLDSSQGPLVRAKAFELLERVPDVHVETVFGKPVIVNFIDRELKGRDPRSGVVRAAVLRTLEKHDLHREHHDAILALAGNAWSDPTGEVREVAIPLAAASATTADLPILFGLLNHANEEAFLLASRAFWDLPIPDAVAFAQLIGPIYRRRERRPEILALAHVLGKGSRETEMLIKVLDVGARPASSLLPIEDDQRLAFRQLRDIVLSSPFRRGVEGKKARFLESGFRVKILEQLTALTQPIDWKCRDTRMLSSFLIEAESKEGTSLFKGANGESFHDALSGAVRALRDNKGCGVIESIGWKDILGWAQDWIFWILGLLTLGEYVRRRRSNKPPSDPA